MTETRCPECQRLFLPFYDYKRKRYQVFCTQGCARHSSIRLCNLKKAKRTNRPKAFKS